MSWVPFYDKELLVNVHVITFTRSLLTKSRRGKKYPQLVCDPSGSAGCPRAFKYQFPTAVCTNIGLGDDHQPRWACTADHLPDDVELGSVLVGCEGFDGPNDPYVLRGSCNLTYTLEREQTGSTGGLFVFFAVILCCCCCCFTAKNRMGGKKRAPPPIYEEVASMEPIMASAVPVDVQGKSLSEITAGYEDPEKGRAKGSASAAPPASRKGGVAEVSGAPGSTSNTSGGMGTGTAVAVGAVAAAATAAVAATAAASSRPGQGNLPQGWEARVEPSSGDVYYVDHSTRTTTWTYPAQMADPRMHQVGVQNQVQHGAMGAAGTRQGWGSGPWGRAWTRHTSPSADLRPSQPAPGAPPVSCQAIEDANYRQHLISRVQPARGGGGWGDGLKAVWTNIFGDGSNSLHGSQGHTSTSFGSMQQREDQKGGWGYGEFEGGHTSTAFGGTQRRDGPRLGGGGGGGGGGHTGTAFGGTHRR